MCVAISMEPGTELSLDEVEKMTKANADGIGVAWAEDGQVFWYKSIAYEPKAAQKFIEERKGFFRLVHFRLATAGGGRVELCHPFEVGPMANCSKTGHSSQVLIHNGHWHRWTDVIDILRKEGALPDIGPWSDSRLAAFLASHDPDWLDAVNGKVALMDGEGNTKLLGTWESLRPGIKVSNKNWEHNYNYRRSGKDRHWTGWGWSDKEWEQKEAHDAAQAQEAKEDKGEKGKKGDNNGAKTTGTGNGQAHSGQGQSGSGSGPGHVVGAGTATAQAGGEGHHAGVQRVGAKPFATHCRGPLLIGDVAKVYRREDGIVYSHVPWKNEHTGVYYWIPPGSVRGDEYDIEQLSPDEARLVLESPAATLLSTVRIGASEG